MARTKAQVVSFLDSQVGQSVNAKSGIYRGQCVSLIKALLEYLGVPDPYAARGNAKDVGDTLLRQNIAENGKGQITVVVNRSMGNIGGVTYGHIWIDIGNIANYEQNGNSALYTTKNTRPISQGQQFVNLDKWLAKPEPPKEKKEMVTLHGLQVLYKFYLGTGVSEYGMKNRLGKQTFDEASEGIRSSDAFKKKLADVKANQSGLAQHLPQAIQELLKLPEQVK